MKIKKNTFSTLVIELFLPSTAHSRKLKIQKNRLPLIPRSLIHGLKPLCIWPNIRRKNQKYSYFSGVIDSTKTISSGSLTLLTRFQRGHWPPAQFQWGHWPRCNFYLKFLCWKIRDFIFSFSSVIDPAETDFDYLQSDYLGKYEAICKEALARESVP
jgi:hypothetical protein